MRLRKRIAWGLVGLGFVTLCGCGRHSNKEIYYLITVNSALPYWQTGAAGFNRAAAQYKVTARVVGPDNYNPQAELAALQRAVASKPAGILISAADAAVLTPGIDAAINAGIPVITIDSDAESSRRLYFIGTNNLEAGRLGGRRLAEKLTGHANVIVFTFAGQPNLEERLKGIKDALSNRPDIKIVDVIDIKGDPRTAFDRAQELLGQTAANKIDAFICLESSSGKIVADAIRRVNATDRLLIAWDVNQDTLDGIKAGTIDSTIAQKPYTMGYVGLKALDQIHHSPPRDLTKDYEVDSFSPFPVFVDTGASLVDKNNVEIYIASAAEGNR